MPTVAREGEDEEPTEPSTATLERAPDVDGVPHVDRIELPEPRRAALGVDHLGIDNVYVARNDEGLVIDTLYFDPTEFTTIADDIEAASEHTEGMGWIREHPALRTFRPEQRLTVVTELDSRRAPVVEFLAYRDANEGSLLAKFEWTGTVPAQGLVLRGSTHASAKLHAIVTRRPSPAIMKILRRKAAPTGLGSQLRPKHVTVSEIGFRSAGSRLVVVNLYREEEEEDMFLSHLSGAFVWEPDGTTHPIAPVRVRHQPVQISYRVDLDGDGLDAIGFRTDDASNGYQYLSVWDGAAYRNLRLQGSGG